MVKPEYKIPTMEQIRKIKKNGCSVVSFFSGGGGSSLGYRMAGYKVVYANEFVESARDTYNANKEEYTYVDERDIRNITPESVLDIIRCREGEVDIVDGSPPCSAFSMQGKREKHWGTERKYSDKKAQIVDDLFFEYIRMIQGIQPKVFIAENVKGLVIGKAKGYFKQIMYSLKQCGYNVKAAVLNSAHLGVPQTRERLIFIGVRGDIKITPTYPRPFNYVYTFSESTIGCDTTEYKKITGKTLDMWNMAKIEESFKDAGDRIGIKSGGFARVKIDKDKPCKTITTIYEDKLLSEEPRTLSIGELKRVCSFPDDFILTGTYQQKYERLGRAVPPIMMKHIALHIYKTILKGKSNGR